MTRRARGDCAPASRSAGVRVTPPPACPAAPPCVPGAPASSGRDSQVVQPTLVHAGDIPLPKSLAFVNRSAEALDVLFANLQSERIVARDEVVKLRMPLASQPPGTGKTLLGKNLIAVLRRPREDAALEERVAARLATAWCW